MGDVQGFIDSLVPVVESPYKYYTVRIDLNNPDPETSCTYMDDAVGMTPGYDGWKNELIIDSIKPCILTDGGEVVGYFLDKEDMSKGYSSTFATEPELRTDYMIEFPLMGYKLWNDENYQYVSVTDDPNAEDKGYCYYAHSLNVEKDCDKIYIGAFLGYVDGLILYSDKDKTPTTSTSLIDFRNYAASYSGEGYSLISFYPWTLLQCLYVIIYKNLNSQAALGQGYTNASAIDVTGTTLSQPFCSGDPNNNTKHVKFLGIEDFWGNLYGWLDGLYLDGDDNILTDYRNSQFTGSGHNFQFNTGQIYGRPGYISKILGNNAGGFVPTEFNGSNSTYFADEGNVYPECFGICGGCGGGWLSGAEAGAFCLSLSSSDSSAGSNVGARLMYKHLAS